MINGIEKYHYHDAEKFASLFVEDGILISSSGVAVKGTKNLRNVFSKRYASIYDGDIEMSIEDLNLTESVAAVRGMISETVKPTENSRPIHAKYYYSLLAEKVNGEWKAKWMMGVKKREH